MITPPPASPPLSLRALLLPAMLGAVGACALHLPAVMVPYWQDDYGLLSRAVAAQTPWELMLPTEPGSFWRPLTMGGWWWAGVRVWGPSALAFHAAGLVVLFATSVLAGLVGGRWAGWLSPGSPTRWSAAGGALLFAGHGAFLLPTAWASGAQETLALCFALAGVLAWSEAGWASDPRRRGCWLAAVPLAFVGGLASKEGVIVLPVLLAVVALAGGWLTRRWAMGMLAMLALMAAGWLVVRAQYVVPPAPSSPYALTMGFNVPRNAVALGLFSLNLPREAVHIATEGHRWAGLLWGGAAVGLYIAGLALAWRAWHRALGARGWALLAAWYLVAIGPYLLLRVNCYPYYALIGLMPLAVLGGLMPGWRAAALMVGSSALALWGQWAAPYPATIARARLAEASHRHIAAQPLPATGPVYMLVGEAQAEFNALGWQEGLAHRTGVAAERWVLLEPGEPPPAGAPAITFGRGSLPVYTPP